MAILTTLAEAIANFEQASTGSEVKKSLIDLLETANSVGGNTVSLGGHDKSYYVLEKGEGGLKELERTLVDLYLKFTDEPSNDDTKKLLLLRNKDFTNFFKTRILDAIRALNGDKKGDIRPDAEEAHLIGNDIREALTLLDGTVGYIKSAINAKVESQHQILDTDSFMVYGDKLAEINYNEIKVKPLTATENKEYEGKKVEGRYVEAFNPVTVKLALKGQTITATENNKDYTPEEGYDGIASVYINIPDSSLGNGSGGSSGGGGGYYGGGGGALQGDNVNVGPTTITANGEYSASQYGLDGFDEVHVEVDKFEIPEDTTFTVTFMDRDGTVLDTATDVQPGTNVKYNGSVNPPVYQKDAQGNTYNDDFWVFAGWDPEPINVLSDLTCYAKYTNWYPISGNPVPQPYRYINKPVQGDVGGYGEWEDILEDGGAKANVGDVKLLKLNKVGNSGVKGRGLIVRMMKVYGREDTATSVWMSLDAIGMTIDNEDWGNSTTRTYLNDTFLNTLIPEWLRPHIANMEKYCLCRTTAPASSYPNGPIKFVIGNNEVSAPDNIPGMVVKPFTDKIWLPSYHELNLLGVDDGGEFSNKIYHVTNSNAKITVKGGVFYNSFKYPQRTYFGLISDVGSVYYKGTQYSEIFKYFSGTYKTAQSFRSLMMSMGVDCADENSEQVIRHLLPHIKRTVNECQGDPDKEAISLNWDSLSYKTQYKNSTKGTLNSNFEPPLDLYEILQTNLLSYLPGVFNHFYDNPEHSCYHFSGIVNVDDLKGGTACRDVYLRTSSMTYNTNTRQWNEPTADYRRAGTDSFGYFPSSGGPANGVFCFGIRTV